MEYWTRVLGDVSVVAFALLAVLTCARWRRHRIDVGWAAVTFALLGGIGLLTRLQPSLLTEETAVKILIAAVVLVPYCLFRFATSLREASTVVHVLAVGLTAGVIVSTFIRPHLPLPGFPYLPVPGFPSPPTQAGAPPHLLAYQAAFVTPFAFVSTFVGVRLFRDSGGRPTVSAYRMRLTATAVLGLGLCCAVSLLGDGALGPNDLKAAQVAVLVGQALMVAVGALFLVALALPSWLAVVLGQRGNQAFRWALWELMAAARPIDLAERLLPRVASLAGAPTAALLDQDGAVVARYPAPGSERDESRGFRPAGCNKDGIIIRTKAGTGNELAVLVDPYLRYFGTVELHELEQLARMSSLAMQRCDQIERVAFQASHDGLTGLCNRTHFVERLSDALRHVGRRHDVLAVMFIDLDHFKRVNDEIDHPAGDVVLSTVGDRLTAMTRGVDLVARLGGDEFAVFAEVDDARDAIGVAERLRTGVVEPIAVCDKKITITASIGVVVTTDGSTTPAVLLGEADHAMYDAKRAGGDQVVLRAARARDVAALRWGLKHPRGERVNAGSALFDRRGPDPAQPVSGRLPGRTAPPRSSGRPP